MDETEVERTVWLLICQAQEKLQWAADLLRGPEVPASERSMRLEIDVSKVLDVLSPHVRRA